MTESTNQVGTDVYTHLDDLPVPILKFNPNTKRIIYANKEIIDVLNHHNKKLSIIGQSYLKVLCKGKAQEQLSQIGTLKAVSEGVVECCRSDKSTFFAKIRIKRKDPATALLIMQVLSNREVVESEELKDFNRRLESFPGMLYTFVRYPDGFHRFTYASPGSRRVYNLSPAEVTAENGASKVISRILDQDTFWETVTKSHNTLTTWNWTGKAKKVYIDSSSEQRHSYQWLRGISEPQQLKDGTVKWNGAVFDITVEMQQKKEIETARRRIAKERERAEMAFEFSEILSHEVRNPLSGIDSCSELISQDLENILKELSQTKDKWLVKRLNVISCDINQVRNCTEYIKSILENTLDLAKMRSHKLKLDISSVSLKRDILDSTVQLFLRTKKDVKVYAECSDKIKIKCDAFRIKQILVNLMNNGLKHTEKGFVKVTAKESENQWLILSVEDSGPGIPKEMCKRVFQKYENLSSVMGRSGHGIGLSLCQQLVVIMGGTIRIDTTYTDPIHGKGTRIEIKLPLEPADFTESNIMSDAVENIELPPHLHVLVCDDSKVGQALLVRRLESFTRSWKFDTYASGEATINGVKSKNYDLIIVDEHLTDGGGSLKGHETMQIIRKELGIKTPIIGCSANELTSLHRLSGASLGTSILRISVLWLTVTLQSLEKAVAIECKDEVRFISADNK